MFVSGFATKSKALAGTPLETVEKVGSGSVTVFGYEPNFRAVADGRLAAQRGDPAHAAGSVPSTTPPPAAPSRLLGASSGRTSLVRPDARA